MTMKKAPSLLFAGTHFNRKHFAKDIARFKVAGSKKEKKRKHKTKESEVMEGFNVFKTSKYLKIRDVTDEDYSVWKRKELEKQIERDSIFHKKYGIYISGHKVPSPLRNFEELKSRYGCKLYLLHNILELRFKEPTPIQRATSVLHAHQLALAKLLLSYF